MLPRLTLAAGFTHFSRPNSSYNEDGLNVSMEKHLRMIGILNAVLGAFGVLVSLAALIAAGGPRGVLLINARIGGSTSTLEGYVTLAIIIYLFLMAAPMIATGYGLLKYQEWARNLGMILSIVLLIHIPLGTIVGLYSLWVLTSYEVEPLFKSPPVRRPVPGQKPHIWD